MITISLKSARYLLPLFILFLVSPVAAQKRPWTTQLAALTGQPEAENKVSELKSQGLDAYWIKSNVPGAGVRYRVRVGRYASRAAAQASGQQLRQRGIVQEFFVAEYEAPPKPVTSHPAPAMTAETQPALPSRPRVTATPAPPPATVSQTVKITPPQITRAMPTPTPAALKTSVKEVAGNSGLNAGKVTAAGKPANPGFQTFKDGSVGYSFEHPPYWSGTAWSDAEKLSQNVDGGASFKSREDAAFLNVIWNKLPGASDPNKYDNTLLVDTIIKSMGSGADTQNLNELARRVEQESGSIKTFLDLNALFRDPASSSAWNFLGKAVIMRTQQGILLVVVFYSQDAPPVAATNADRIIRSVRAPE